MGISSLFRLLLRIRRPYNVRPHSDASLTQCFRVLFSLTWLADCISYRYFSAGQLFIENAKKHDAGTYLCTASNGVGSQQTKVISVEVLGKTVMWTRLGLYCLLIFLVSVNFVCLICVFFFLWAVLPEIGLKLIDWFQCLFAWNRHVL